MMSIVHYAALFLFSYFVLASMVTSQSNSLTNNAANGQGVVTCTTSYQATNAALQPFGSFIFQVKSNETNYHCLYSANQVDPQCSIRSYRIEITSSPPTVTLWKSGVTVVAATVLTCPPGMNNYQDYWVLWANGEIEFGCGGTVGVDGVFIYQDPAPLRIRSYAPKTNSSCGCSNVFVPWDYMAGASRRK